MSILHERGLRSCYGEEAREFGAWLVREWHWDAFMSGTFRDRRPGPVFLRPQVQRGWTRPRRSGAATRPATVRYIGPGFALRAWERFVGEVERQTGQAPWWVIALEVHPRSYGERHHLHALVGGVQGLRREWMWQRWFERYGMARVLPMFDGAAVYVGKYLGKGGRVYFSPNLNAVRGMAGQVLPI